MGENRMSSKITANGISINYRFDGPQDGPVVMLSNSLLSNLTMWDDQIAPLVAAGFRVLRYDQRGHGLTDSPEGPYSIKMFAEDVAGLLEALGIAKVHFVGLSMGGFVAQLMAIHHPEKIASLVLCDTACVMPPVSL
jgi:3-oxoadipate enol-lactonase